MAKCSYEDGNEAVFEEKEIYLCKDCLETAIKDNQNKLLTQEERVGKEEEPSGNVLVERYKKLMQEDEGFYQSEIEEIKNVVSSYNDRGI